MSAMCFLGVPGSYRRGIWGPLFIVEETEAPEGKGRESGHMVASGEAVVRCVLENVREPDLNRGRQFGPVAVWRGDILNLLRPTTRVPSQNAAGMGHSPSLPSAVARLQEG